MITQIQNNLKISKIKIPLNKIKSKYNNKTILTKMIQFLNKPHIDLLTKSLEKLLLLMKKNLKILKL
jgi:hypothetical protein